MTSKSRVSKKNVLVASLALLTMGLGGSIATGAYFTDTKTVTSNELTAGTVLLGNIADNSASTAPVTFTNVLPVAANDVATKAQTFNINVRNTGTASIDWAAVITLTSSDFAKQVNVQYSVDNGSTWSTATTLDALNGTKISSSAPLASAGTSVIKFRAWLPSGTDNSAQGKSIAFALNVNAIQAGGVYAS